MPSCMMAAIAAIELGQEAQSPARLQSTCIAEASPCHRLPIIVRRYGVRQTLSGMSPENSYCAEYVLLSDAQALT